MATTLACPHCRKPVLLQLMDTDGIRCSHCRAQLQFDWRARILATIVAVAAAVVPLSMYMGLLLPLIAANKPGQFDRGSWINHWTILPFIVLSMVVYKLVVVRNGSLELETPKWPLKLSMAEKKLMRQYGISTNGEYFAVNEVHFDTLKQAVAHARWEESRRSQS